MNSPHRIIGLLVTELREASSRPCPQRTRAGDVTKCHGLHLGPRTDYINAAKTKGWRKTSPATGKESKGPFPRDAGPEQGGGD